MANRTGKDEKRNKHLAIALMVLVFIGIPVGAWNSIVNSNYKNLDQKYQYAAETYTVKSNTAHYIATIEATPNGSSECAWIGTALDFDNNPVIIISVTNDMSRYEYSNYDISCTSSYHISKQELEDLIVYGKDSKVFNKVRNDSNCSLDGNFLEEQSVKSDIRTGAKLTYSNL